MKDGQLPQKWTWLPLGEICTQDRMLISPNSELNSRPYLSLEHVESNTGKVLRTPAARMEDEGRSTTFAFDSRHVLYGKLRPYLNKVALPTFEGRCTTEMIPLLPVDTNRVFLAWILRRAETVDVAMRNRTGSRMPRADMDELLKMHVPVPPLAEQQRIAAIIEAQMAEIDAARAAVQAQLDAAEKLASSYLREVFESDEAQGWEEVQLGDVINIIVPTRDKPKRFVGNIPWVTLPDLDGLTIDNAKNCLTLEDAAEVSNRLMPPYTILLSCAGSVGKVAITTREVFANQQFYGLVVKPEVLDPFFLAYSLKSLGEDFFYGLGGTTTLSFFSKGRTLGIRLRIPKVEAQSQIVADLMRRMETTDAVIDDLRAQLDLINQLPTVLLRQAFRGDL